MEKAFEILGILILPIVILRFIVKEFKLERRIKLLEHIIINEEHRCWKCTKQENCPAAFTGVAYPCEHFEKEDSDGNEK